jgi:hypothetical protein
MDLGWMDALVWVSVWIVVGLLVHLASWLSPKACAARRARRRARQAGALPMRQGPDGTWEVAA